MRGAALLANFIQRLKSPRLWRFAAVGFSGVFINLGMLWLFADVLHVDERVAAALKQPLAVFGVKSTLSSALAIEVSIIWNFLLNNAWTFSDRNAQASAGFLARMARYNVVSLVGLVIQLAAFVALCAMFVRMFELDDVGIWKYPAQLVGIGVAMAWNLVSNFYFTWAQRSQD